MKKEKLKYGMFPNRLFIGEILEDELDRQFIIDKVEALYYPKQQIVKTKLLYTFPVMKIQNPHVHVDNVPNYIVIMTL
jgi:hypothetical protein